MTEILAIGRYSESDMTEFRRIGAKIVPGFEEVAALSDADRAKVRAVAYNSHHGFGAGEMARLPALGVIANYGVGYDSIDVAAADARDIKVTNTPDVLNDDVADLAVAMLIMQSRRMAQADAHIRSGEWAKGTAFPLGRKFSGRRAGIVGLGRIGRDIADRLAAFKMEMHYHSRSEKETPGWTFHADPVSLAKAVDYLVVALVGGPETENYISAEVIAALGPEGVLVNISRGSTVDEAALLDALETGRLRGAGLDVFRGEPKIDPRFLALDNVVLQPHQGSGTVETRRAMGQLQRDNITAFLNGASLLTAVN